MAEWWRSGLQIRVPRFDSGWCLHIKAINACFYYINVHLKYHDQQAAILELMKNKETAAKSDIKADRFKELGLVEPTVAKTFSKTSAKTWTVKGNASQNGNVQEGIREVILGVKIPIADETGES